MSTATITESELDVIDGEAGDPVHIFCYCDPETTLCGLPIPEVDGWEGRVHEVCALCQLVDDDPCPKCGGQPKRWWQVWR